MRRLLATLFLAVLVVVPALAAPGAAIPPFTVTLPGPAWTVNPDAQGMIEVELKDEGIDVIIRSVPNPGGLNAERLARQLRHRIMDSPAAVGHQFSTIRTCKVGGQPASRFTMEQAVGKGTHRSVYSVMSYGKEALVVAVLGGAFNLDQHAKEIDQLLASVKRQPH